MQPKSSNAPSPALATSLAVLFLVCSQLVGVLAPAAATEDQIGSAPRLRSGPSLWLDVQAIDLDRIQDLRRDILESFDSGRSVVFLNSKSATLAALIGIGHDASVVVATPGPSGSRGLVLAVLGPGGEPVSMVDRKKLESRVDEAIRGADLGTCLSYGAGVPRIAYQFFRANYPAALLEPWPR